MLISTSASGRASAAMTVVRVGGSFGQYVLYTSFIAAKSAALRRYTITLAAIGMLEPAAFKIVAIWSSVCLVCAEMSPDVVPAAVAAIVPET